MKLILSLVATGGLTLVLALVVNSIVEWIIHAKILHAHDGPPAEDHGGHHTVHQGVRYKKQPAAPSKWILQLDPDYGVAPMVFRYIISGMTALSLIAGWLTGHYLLVPIISVMTTATYFYLFGVVHRRVHVPIKGGWFEGTVLYRYLDRMHQVHHARGDRNFCILLPFIADWLLRTLHRPRVSVRA